MGVLGLRGWLGCCWGVVGPMLVRSRAFLATTPKTKSKTYVPGRHLSFRHQLTLRHNKATPTGQPGHTANRAKPKIGRTVPSEPYLRTACVLARLCSGENPGLGDPPPPPPEGPPRGLPGGSPGGPPGGLPRGPPGGPPRGHPQDTPGDTPGRGLGDCLGVCFGDTFGGHIKMIGNPEIIGGGGRRPPPPMIWGGRPKAAPPIIFI